ncbi:hypothetical protein HMPREF1980_00746 [Actinomyces sp. oral taxon 172 str. F0311]|nr:hypothetical protein HMPREF1980_00746 [Actinomyces sp. oral taxon 172 str. F0311]
MGRFSLGWWCRAPLRPSIEAHGSSLRRPLSKTGGFRAKNYGLPEVGV